MTRSFSKQTGTIGENAAVTYLMSLGYKIIERNVRLADGEIDVIAHLDGVTVFVEVKSRAYSSAARYGRASNSVTYIKKKRFTNAVKEYQRSHPEAMRCRIDVVEVYFPRGICEEMAEIKHIKSAFGES